MNNIKLMYSRIFELENCCGGRKDKKTLRSGKRIKRIKKLAYGEARKSAKALTKRKKKFLNFPIYNNDETHEFSNWRMVVVRRELKNASLRNEAPTAEMIRKMIRK